MVVNPELIDAFVILSRDTRHEYARQLMILQKQDFTAEERAEQVKQVEYYAGQCVRRLQEAEVLLQKYKDVD